MSIYGEPKRNKGDEVEVEVTLKEVRKPIKT
jgi:hypothetical protein